MAPASSGHGDAEGYRGRGGAAQGGEGRGELGHAMGTIVAPGVACNARHASGRHGHGRGARARVH